jgi:cobalt-precorrin-7 (C5)-methyltransferase
MIVVGVGCGPGMLTQEAVAEIGKAKSVFGSKRAIGLAREFISPDCEVREIKDYSKVREFPADAVLLSTGDPMLAGLGSPGTRVVPGISSMQVAFARLGLPLSRVAAVVAHGRCHDKAITEAVEELSRGKIVFIVADPGFDVKRLFASLAPACSIAICEDLGYDSERIATGTASSPPEARSRLFSVVTWGPEGVQ